MLPGPGGMRLRSIIRGSCAPRPDAALPDGAHRGGPWTGLLAFGLWRLASGVQAAGVWSRPLASTSAAAHFGHAGTNDAQFSREREGMAKASKPASTASKRQYRLKRGGILPSAACLACWLLAMRGAHGQLQVVLLASRWLCNMHAGTAHVEHRQAFRIRRR
jgi:hypothetical protein